MFKKFINIILVMAAAVMASTSCDKVEPQDPSAVQLEVNAHNISGLWNLVSEDGAEIMEGSFRHIEFIRNEKKFIMTDGMIGFPGAAGQKTGRFDFEYKDGLGTVLIGLYDHDEGFWNDKYLITSLTRTRLELKGLKSGHVQIFEKIIAE